MVHTSTTFDLCSTHTRMAIPGSHLPSPIRALFLLKFLSQSKAQSSLAFSKANLRWQSKAQSSLAIPKPNLPWQSKAQSSLAIPKTNLRW
ncbi:hypothetical protein A2U01_0064951 [Trifolium medium]|uniref:Uncharacterized protein n=1 Tax=Trifolium medium TaxID=97028 RepID=A0A392S487_9FABA|nr:hypothetical protein [Trifolium medium]